MNLLRRITALFTNRPGSAPTSGAATPLNDAGVRREGTLRRILGRR